MPPDTAEACARQLACDVEFRHLAEHIAEMKQRIARLEQTLNRGVLLLVANLVAVIVTAAGNALAL
jgi:hypothetical protein